MNVIRASRRGNFYSWMVILPVLIMFYFPLTFLGSVFGLYPASVMLFLWGLFGIFSIIYVAKAEPL